MINCAPPLPLYPNVSLSVMLCHVIHPYLLPIIRLLINNLITHVLLPIPIQSFYSASYSSISSPPFSLLSTYSPSYLPLPLELSHHGQGRLPLTRTGLLRVTVGPPQGQEPPSRLLYTPHHHQVEAAVTPPLFSPPQSPPHSHPSVSLYLPLHSMS